MPWHTKQQKLHGQQDTHGSNTRREQKHSPEYGSLYEEHTVPLSEKVANLTNATHERQEGVNNTFDHTSPKLAYDTVNSAHMEPHAAAVLSIRYALKDQCHVSQADLDWLFPESAGTDPPVQVETRQCALGDETVADRLLRGTMDLVHSMYANGRAQQKICQDQIVLILHTLDAKITRPCSDVYTYLTLPAAPVQGMGWRMTSAHRTTFIHNMIYTPQYNARRYSPDTGWLVRGDSELRQLFFKMVTATDVTEYASREWVIHTEWARDLLREEIVKDMIRAKYSRHKPPTTDKHTVLPPYDSWVNSRRTTPYPLWVRKWKERDSHIALLLEFAENLEFIIKQDDGTRCKHQDIPASPALVQSATDIIMETLRDVKHPHIYRGYLRDRLIMDTHTGFRNPSENSEHDKILGLERWNPGEYLLNNKDIHKVMADEFKAWSPWARHAAYESSHTQQFAMAVLFGNEDRAIVGECAGAPDERPFQHVRCDLFAHQYRERDAYRKCDKLLLGTLTTSVILVLFRTVWWCVHDRTLPYTPRVESPPRRSICRVHSNKQRLVQTQ